MSTRSNYRVISTYKDEITRKQKKVTLLNVYVQSDGYPEGHPLDTMKWLATGKVVNGISITEKALIFNGVGCLAAQLIARLKNGVGGTYIHDISAFGLCGEDYMYDIIVDDDDKTIKIVAYENNTSWDANRASKKKIFEGTPQEFVEKYN